MSQVALETLEAPFHPEYSYESMTYISCIKRKRYIPGYPDGESKEKEEKALALLRVQDSIWSDECQTSVDIKKKAGIHLS